MRFLELILISIFFISFSNEIYSQKKIKGDKEVVSVNGRIEDDFNSIQLGKDIKLILHEASNTSYILTTDQNLVDHIKFTVIEGVLDISSDIRISNSKKLEVVLSYRNLNKITLQDRADLKSTSRLTADNFQIDASDNSKFDLILDTQNLQINLSKGAGGKIKLNADKLNINLKDRSSLKGTINAGDLDLRMANSSSLDLKGDLQSANLNLRDRADLKGKKLKIKNVNLNAVNNTDVHVFASKSIQILAEGKSRVYVYGNPKIELKGLTDKSRIIKK